MKLILSLFCFTLFISSCSFAQDVPCNDVAQLTIKLKAIRDSDQNTRMVLIKQMSQPADAAKILQLTNQMHVIDNANQLFIGKMLDQCGWPKGLAFFENNTIFLVIDHADTTFMNKYLPVLKQQADLGVVQKSDLATLLDRMQMRRGLKQLYGTQTFKNTNTQQTVFWPIEDPEHLADRRQAMGLFPMDSYIEAYKSMYHSDPIWDKGLSLEDAKKARGKQ